MIFVDTGAWFAAYAPTDPDHAAAIRFLSSMHEPLITTDYVIDELLTLLRMRGLRQRARLAGEALLKSDVCRIEWVTQADFRAAWNVFQAFYDKRWSFTDCISREVMQRLDVRCAFAFDDHFRQFGTVEVVPHSP